MARIVLEMDRMRSRRFRLWLLLALLAGLASCDLNPQPSLPDSDKGSGVHGGGTSAGPSLSTGGNGGSLALNPGTAGSVGGNAASGGGPADNAEGGAAPVSEAGGAGGAGDAEPHAGGAGGAVDTGPK